MCVATLAVSGIVAICTVLAADAQVPPECATSECAIEARQPLRGADQSLLRDAAAGYQLKRQFVEALQRFIRAQAGTFGDEGAELDASLSEMASAVARWDAAVDTFQSRASRLVSSADVHLLTASVLLDRMRVANAITEIEAAARIDDGRADVHLLGALAYRLAGRGADATRALRRAASLDAGDPTVFYALSQPAANAPDTDAAAQARRSFQRAVRAAGPQRRDAATSGPFDRIDLLRQAGGVAPVFAEARYAEGFMKLAEGDYRSAVDQFRAAGPRDPLLTGTTGARDRRLRAAALLRAGQLQAARDEIERAAAQTPDDAETQRILGLTLWVAGDTGRAVTQLRAAIRLAPDDARARLVLARVLADDGRANEAERELSQMLESGLASGRAHYQLGQLYQRQGRLEQASQQLELASRYGPIIGRDYFFRLVGSTLVDRADFDGAVSAYLRRIDVNPNSAEAHRQLGEVYFLRGRNDEALLELTTAAWLDPTDAKAHAGAGQAHLRATSYDSAADAFERALVLDSGLMEARYGLALSLVRLGKGDEGRTQMAMFEQMQAAAAADGQRAFQADALRRDASRSLIAGMTDEAVRLLIEAVRLDGSARSHRDLAVALIRAKRPADAFEHIEAARRLEETPEILGLLADAFAAAGNAEESTRARAQERRLSAQRRLERLL